jgi:predicted amidohydrolase
MKIAMAQTSPILGNVKANMTTMLDLMHEHSGKADLLVFPELSLTGYMLKDQVHDVAITPDSREMNEVCQAAKDLNIDVMFGFVEDGKGDRVYNSAAFIKDGGVSTIQRKIYPTTYGIFEEGKYFARGKKVRTAQAGSYTTSMLICNDLWHPSLPHIAAHKHTSLLVGLINSPEGGLGSTYSSSIGWERVAQFYAGIYGCYVVIVNRVGQEGDISFYGNSKIIDPYGHVIDQCPFNDEATQICEIDLKKVKELRKILPIMRDEDVELTIRHYQEIAFDDNND